MTHDTLPNSLTEESGSGNDWRWPSAFLIAAVLLLSFRPAQVPPPWFDEGWAMSVARNWVEIGRYGQLLDGQPVSASMLNMGFPAIAPIALSFRVLGIGIWQGRLPGILFALAALVLMYRLARRIFDPTIAAGTLFVLIFASPLPTILYGKQALAESPLLFYLLAGFLCFVNSWNRARLFLFFTIVFWALAMATKLHLLPFLTLSLVVTLGFAAYKGRWRTAGHVAVCLIGSLFFFMIFRQVQEYLLQDRIMKHSSVYAITAFVPIFAVRITAIWVVIILGSTTIIGLLSELRTCFRSGAEPKLETGEQAARFVIFLLVAGWTAWYALLSIGWQRYLFVPVFLGSIFFAAFLHRISAGYNGYLTIRRSALLFRRHCFTLQNVSALFALLLIVLGISRNVHSVYSAFIAERDDALASLVQHTNAVVTPSSLVESYDWEVLFLLSSRYHYPPNEVQLNLDRRAFLGQDVSIDYDPLQADPDYLVIGEQSRFWGLYQASIERGFFRLIYQNPRYSLYQRLRK